MKTLTTFLWFDGNAEDAVNFYQGVFPDLVRGQTMRWGADLPVPEGAVLTVEFQLFGQNFVALNAGPQYKPTPAISLMIPCDNQAEVDHYWNALMDGGEALACGWLTDRFGFAWQVTPTALLEYTKDPDPAKVHRVMTAMMDMVKLDIEALKRAYEG